MMMYQVSFCSFLGMVILSKLGEKIDSIFEIASKMVARHSSYCLVPSYCGPGPSREADSYGVVIDPRRQFPGTCGEVLGPNGIDCSYRQVAGPGVQTCHCGLIIRPCRYIAGPDREADPR